MLKGHLCAWRYVCASEILSNNYLSNHFQLFYAVFLTVRFTVSSTTSVVAALGSDVVLPCHLTPEMNAEKMEIRWFKPMYQPYVHLYINGKDDYTAQMPQFANRTELLKENITRGIFPLKIRNVTAQDSGEYYCFVESTEHHGMAAVQLQVTETGLPEACRDQYSRYIVFWPCLTYLLVCIGYICHQSMKLSKYLKRFIAT
uniref:Ig-like domain-containing protein n=1 Tax=Xenopus tropicalis TaxID=8364 RepID=F6TXV1_XENTR